MSEKVEENPIDQTHQKRSMGTTVETRKARPIDAPIPVAINANTGNKPASKPTRPAPARTMARAGAGHGGSIARLGDDVVVERHQIRIEDQFRKRFDPDEIDQMAESIRKLGLIHPLVICPDGITPGSQYVLASGQRRLMAIDKLASDGFTVPIRAVLRPQNEKVMIQIQENDMRVDLDPLERAASYHWIVHNDPMTLKPRTEPLSYRQAADVLSKPHDVVYFYIKLATMPEAVKSLLDDGIIESPRALDEVAKFYRNGNDDFGDTVIQLLRNEVPVQRDAMSRLSIVLKDDKVPRSSLLAMLKTGELFRTNSLNLLAEVIKKAPDAERAVNAIMNAFENREGVSLHACIKDAHKLIESVSGNGSIISSSDLIGQGSVPLEPEGDELTAKLDTPMPAPDATAREPSATGSKKSPQKVTQNPSINDAIPQGRVRGTDGSRVGQIIEVVIRWDDGSTDTIQDLSELLVEK